MRSRERSMEKTVALPSGVSRERDEEDRKTAGGANVAGKWVVKGRNGRAIRLQKVEGEELIRGRVPCHRRRSG